jgi:hypothetical protein
MNINKSIDYIKTKNNNIMKEDAKIQLRKRSVLSIL